MRGWSARSYDVVVERTGEGAFFRVTTETFDLVLLDLGLPGRDGLEILSALRQRGLETPVLILTARDTVQDRVLGLDAGADDYLVKPFAFAELLARIRALARRGRAAEVPQLGLADLAMDLMTRKVARGGRAVDLTVREFELLEYLLGTTARSCRARRWPGTCGRRRRVPPLSTTSSTSTSPGCAARWTPSPTPS